MLAAQSLWRKKEKEGDPPSLSRVFPLYYSTLVPICCSFRRGGGVRDYIGQVPRYGMVWYGMVWYGMVYQYLLYLCHEKYIKL